MNLRQSLRRTVAVAAALLFTLTGAAHAGHHASDKAPANIVETADQAGQFATLLAAAQAAGLADTLANGGPFTVFAPTDEAFAALPAGTIESLLMPENKDALAAILKFHVLSGKVTSSALADGIEVDTLAGVKAGISQTEGGFNIENAKIIATDIEASNGVVHVIDRVILPPQTMSSLQAPRNQVVRVIDAAIDAGVPLFNNGNTEATAALYQLTAQSLLALADTEMLDGEARRRLQQGLERASSQHQTRQQAWTLRYALDDVRGQMQTDTMQAARR